MGKSSAADQNVRSFLIFRIFFNARFYYPVLAILFLDLGLSLQQYALLNVAWAAAIVLFEVPSGALADLVGRKKLVVAASFLMVIEMCIFAFAPSQNKEFLFWIFMLNRVFSGVAEACASGADEALVYDSLKSVNREGEWSSVLDRLNKLSAVSFFIAMVVGAAAYDPKFINAFSHFFGANLQLKASDVVRFPLYLTLGSSLVTCYATLTMWEAPLDASAKVSIGRAFENVLESGKWILRSPVSFFVILATLVNDSFLRLFMTLTSKYFRTIKFPEISFGFIGAILGLIGYLSPALAKRFIKLGTARRAYLALSFMSLVGLIGLPLALPYVGLVFVLLISVGMGVLGYMTSFYLNAEAEPARRATILSFEGLCSNLAYGTMGVAFAGLLKTLQTHASGDEDRVFTRALTFLPGAFVVFVALAYALAQINSRYRRRRSNF